MKGLTYPQSWPRLRAPRIPDKMKALWPLSVPLLAVVVWQGVSLLMNAFAWENRPFLLRLIVQSCECVWVVVLLSRLHDRDKPYHARWESGMLFGAWLLMGAWLMICLPMAFEYRNPLLYGTPDLLFFTDKLPWMTSLRWYYLLIWGLSGLAAMICFKAKKKWGDADPVLIPATCWLIFQGILLLARMGPDMQKSGPIGFNQVIFFIIGSLAGGMLLVPAMRRQLFSVFNYPYLLFVAALLCLLSTFFFGTALSGGKALWIKLGGLTFQPVELAKILMVIMFGVLLDRMAMILQLPRRRGAVITLTGICFCFFCTLYLQRDLGPILLLSSSLFLLFLTASRLWWMAPLSVGLAWLAQQIVLTTQWPNIVYQRIIDSQEPLKHSGQLSWALWAQGAGDVWGTGLGFGKATRIPVIESDYIFTAMVAERGLIGGLMLLAVFTALCWRSVQLSQVVSRVNSQDASIILGLALVLFCQGFLIIAGNMALIPLTGITLPFISAGGTSLVMNIGLVFLILALLGRNMEVPQ